MIPFHPRVILTQRVRISVFAFVPVNQLGAPHLASEMWAASPANIIPNAPASDSRTQPNKYQFQYWALGLCGARPTEGIKKGADRGIDGRLYFHDDNSGDSRQVIFSVKGGHN